MLDEEQKILFIGESNSFLVNSVKDGITAAGFSVSFVSLDVTQISNFPDKPELMFMYVDEKVAAETEAIVYIRDLCMEEDKKVFLVGYADELNAVKNMIPSDCVAGVFERPINVKKITDTLKNFAVKADEEKRKHILVVDDSGTMLRTIKGWLDGKYRVSMVNSATSAISFLAINKPDLILLDYEMPICSGPQMLGMLRAEIKTETIPVIFLTSKGDKESVAAVLSLKPQGYLLKSMPPNAIVEAIDNFFTAQKMKSLK